VYAGTRARSEELAELLRRRLGVTTAVYHAGLGREERAETQRRFMADEVEVVVATNAFGMGIDKPDVRTVCHASVPESLEATTRRPAVPAATAAGALLPLRRRARQGLHVHFIQQSAAGEARNARWASYRAIWGFVEGDRCRRAAIQGHFGDRAEPTVAPGIACCDVCDPSALAVAAAPQRRFAQRLERTPDRPPEAAPQRRPGSRDRRGRGVGAPLGRPHARRRDPPRRRSKVIAEHSYDGLELYGATRI